MRLARREERESTPGGLFGQGVGGIPRFTPDDLARSLASAEPPIVLDVRSRSEYQRDDARLPGSIRVLPDQIAAWAAQQPKDRTIVAYCT